MKNKTFGGYFPLELPPFGTHYYPDARAYHSARSALCHFLMTLRPSRLWLPHLICQSVIDAVIKSGIKISWYQLDEDYFPRLSQPFGSNDYLLYVDYLGHCREQKKRLLQTFPAQKIVFDHSQAFFENMQPALANLYSPRKFFGIADGGLLDTSLDIPVPEVQDRSSLSHATHLLLQHEYDTRSGYCAFQQAESALNDINISRMSALSEKILLSVDYLRVKQIRERNYRILRQRLDEINTFHFTDNLVNGPFCYPLFYPARELRQELISQGVFVATYWSEVLQRVDPASVEANYVSYMVPLPCDQRYSEEDMEQLSDIVLSVVKEMNDET
ncbi:hypothetical protein [Atlantibacter sp.]|uniref:hypothetical protein n=1 Tax=Atlantibacter sp. TaxID=1903473 RepID=UPI0028964BA8|nr:hypothetical protein [Atlantibacter sp.]